MHGEGGCGGEGVWRGRVCGEGGCVVREGAW